MRIVHSTPVAGARLAITVELDGPAATVTVFVGDTRLVEWETDECPDPPCYDERNVDLPPSAAERALTIVARTAESEVRATAVVSAMRLREGSGSGEGGAMGA